MVTKAKAAQFGCGPIGCSVVRYAWQRLDIELAGAVDIDKGLVGRDLGEIAGINNKLGASFSAEAVLSQAKRDVIRGKGHRIDSEVLKDRGVLRELIRNHASAWRRGIRRPCAVRKTKA